MSARSERGFHLVELLMALAILALLIALTLPSYRAWQLRADRSDAVRQLVQASQCQEEVRAVFGAYDTRQCLPGEVNRTYRFSISPVNVNESEIYTVSAIPLIAAAQSPCGTLSIDQHGTRSVSDLDSVVRDCWGGR